MSSMLVELFDPHADALRKELKNALNVENVISATNRVLHSIRSEVRNQQLLNEASLDLAIAQIKTSVLLILSVSEVKAWTNEQRKSNVRVLGKSRYYQPIKLLQGVLLLGLIALLLVIKPEYYQLLTLLGVAMILSELVLYLVKLRYEHKQMKNTYAKPYDQGSKEVKYEVLVDPDSYLAALREVIISTDKLVPLMDRKSRESPGNLLEGDKRLMELFQGMVEAADSKDRELALLNAKRIPALLSKYEIKTVYYDGENDEYFDAFPNLKNEETVTVYPALVKNDEILSIGRVLKPGNS